MITGTKENLDDIAKCYLCKEHGTPVNVAWHAKENSFVLRCGHDHYPDEVTKQPSLTEMYKQGEELPEPLQSNVKKAIEKRAARLTKAPGAETFTGVPAVDLGTGELLSKDVIIALAEYAWTYKLDPARGHVCLMYRKPYITIDGYLYHASKEKIAYSLTGRPLKEDEMKAQGYLPGDLGWYSKIELTNTHQVFEGYGFVTMDEREATAKGKPDQKRYPIVAAKPGLLVIKRGDWQVLRRAFPIGKSPKREEEKNDSSR